jgi:Family of unknown function (DUF6314)
MRDTMSLDFLLGSWSVERSISDSLSGDVGTFHGTATFMRDDDNDARVCFHESGVVRFGDYSGQANRRLFLSLGSGSVIDVSFADGHHFIDLDLREGRSSDHHQCQNDGYEVTTVVRSDDLIEERWRVVGPAKDYEAVTFMTRMTTTPNSSND